MRRGLFGKRFSVQEIEAEVTEQIETMVRSGKNPPPATWTLLGGLPVEDAAESSAPPATAPRADDAQIGATDAAEVVEGVEIEEPESEPEAAAEEAQTLAPPRKPRATAPKAATPTKGARATAGARTTKAKTASPGAGAAGSASASTRARSAKSGRVSASPASGRSRS